MTRRGTHRKILVRLGALLLDRVDLLATEHGQSRTGMITMLLEDSVSRYERRLDRLDERMEKMGISNTPTRAA